ncbi:MAG: twin-arginine translocase subunit TatC [Chloroflexi bacterium]|nr:twin-arginine translocase subunit TatC [Chloroflexota bacterium]
MAEDEEEASMSVLEHLAELRHRLIIVGIVTAVTVGVAAVFLTWPVIGLLSIPAGIKLAALRPAETFVTYMKVSLVTGIGLAMPIIVWQGLLFLLPALHKNERRWIYIGVPAISVSFATGLAFGFFFVIPFAVRFLMGFGGDVVEAVWSVEAYLSFVSSLILWIGASFETPVVLFFLAKIGVVNARQLGSVRRYALVGAFVLGALITPTPDPLNQIIVSVPIYLLYELGIFLARFA